MPEPNSAVFIAMAWEIVVALGVGALGGALATYRLFAPAAIKAVDAVASASSEVPVKDYVVAPADASFDYKLVLLIRQDLKMEKGKIAAQVRLWVCAVGCNSFVRTSAAMQRSTRTSAPSSRHRRFSSSGRTRGKPRLRSRSTAKRKCARAPPARNRRAHAHATSQCFVLSKG